MLRMGDNALPLPSRTTQTTYLNTKTNNDPNVETNNDIKRKKTLTNFQYYSINIFVSGTSTISNIQSLHTSLRLTW